MNLLNLSLKPEYRSLRDDIVNEFYIPALRNAVLYQRAVGFFSSTALIDLSVGLFALFQDGGKVQLVVSPRLTDDDIAAITKGYEHRTAVVERALMSEFREPTSHFEAQRLNLLAHFIAINRLDIKVAFTCSEGRRNVSRKVRAHARRCGPYTSLYRIDERNNHSVLSQL